MRNLGGFNKFVVMIRVCAYQSFNGSGVYEYEGQLYLIEPPYTSAQSRLISHAQLHYLSRQLDYVLVNVSCAGFPEVKDYLITQSKTWTNPHGNAVVDEVTLIKGLSTLSEADLADLISNLHADLIGAGNVQEIQVALDRLWKINKVVASPYLRDALRALEVEVALQIAQLQQIQNSPSLDMFQHVRARYPGLPLQAALQNPFAA
jgi:hypothetical protein